MKRTIIVFFLIVTLIFTLPSCQNKNGDASDALCSQEMEPLPEGPYRAIQADWMLYNNVKELVEHSNTVYIGKVVDIVFEVVDITTALPPTEETDVSQYEFCTMYEVEVLTVYKGELSDHSRISVPGGLPNYQTEKQLQAMEQGNYPDRGGIPIWNQIEKATCQIGQTYLFVLYQFESGCPTVINMTQSIFNLEDPSRKQTSGFCEKVYYSGDEDEHGYSIISAKDIISEFGQDQWNTFYTQWKNNELS